LSSTATIKNRDNGSSTAAGAIMPCVGGLIFWVDFPSKQCKSGNDWPVLFAATPPVARACVNQVEASDADECNFKQT